MRLPHNNKDIVQTQENDIDTGKGNSDAKKTEDLSAGPAQSGCSTQQSQKPCFFEEDTYWFCLDWLGDAGERYDIAIHAFVLMTNHIQLLMTPCTASDKSRVMRWLGNRQVDTSIKIIGQQAPSGRVVIRLVGKNDGSVIERYCVQTGMLALSMMCEKQWRFLYRSETIFLKSRLRKA